MRSSTSLAFILKWGQCEDSWRVFHKRYATLNGDVYNVLPFHFALFLSWCVMFQFHRKARLYVHRWPSLLVERKKSLVFKSFPFWTTELLVDWNGAKIWMTVNMARLCKFVTGLIFEGSTENALDNWEQRPSPEYSRDHRFQRILAFTPLALEIPPLALKILNDELKMAAIILSIHLSHLSIRPSAWTWAPTETRCCGTLGHRSIITLKLPSPDDDHGNGGNLSRLQAKPPPILRLKWMLLYGIDWPTLALDFGWLASERWRKWWWRRRRRWPWWGEGGHDTLHKNVSNVRSGWTPRTQAQCLIRTHTPHKYVQEARTICRVVSESTIIFRTVSYFEGHL